MTSMSSRLCSARFWRTIGRWSGLSALIRPEHFYDPLHGRIFETMSQMIERGGVVVTPLTLHATMKADPGVIETGGQAYFEALAHAAPAMPNVRDYADILHDLAVRRSLIRIGEDIVNTAYEAPTEKTSKDQIAEAEKALYAVSESTKYGEGAARFPRGAAADGGNGRNGARRAAAGFPASPPASPISTSCWAACSLRTF